MTGDVAMGELAKFTFDNAFDDDQASQTPHQPEQDPRELPVYSEVDLEAARAEAFEEGTVVGEQRARDAAHEAIVAVLDRIGRQLPGLVARFAEIEEDARKQAAVLAFKIASKLAGELIERQPLAEVEAMIADALSQLGEQGNVPRIVVRVAEDLVDGAGQQVPVVTTSGQYSYLGKLVVSFDRFGTVEKIDQDASGPIRIARGDTPNALQPDCTVRMEVVNRLKDGLDLLAQPIVATEVGLDGRRNSVRTRETNLGNLMADSLLWQVGLLASEFGALPPDVAIQNGGGIRSDLILPAGQFREIDTFAMAPFGNLVTVVEEVSRSQFKEILENAVSRAVEGDASGGTGRFAQVSGFRFEWSASGTAQVLNPDGTVQVPGSRVQRVVLETGAVIVGGGKVIPGADLTVATLDFLARGGDEYPYRGSPFTVLGVTNQQALTDYVRFLAGQGKVITAADYPEGGEGRIKRLP